MKISFDILNFIKTPEEKPEEENPYEEENPGRIEARAWRYEDDTKTDH